MALRKQRQHRHSTTSSIARAPPVSKVAPVLSRAFDISLSIYNSVTMASSGVNVLRFSALGLGVAYGFYHQSAITAADKLRENQKLYEHKQSLINQARQEYQKKTAPPSKSGGMLPLVSYHLVPTNRLHEQPVVSDPSDPKFDLESWLKSVQ
ncbi:hypothetical protein D6D27_04875 [Aureobasidium pullulans]|nr:hypothetical protein D6D27_04875 [Aureobasidium pullulans]